MKGFEIDVLNASSSMNTVFEEVPPIDSIKKMHCIYIYIYVNKKVVKDVRLTSKKMQT